jgi:hypothetical protein
VPGGTATKEHRHRLRARDARARGRRSPARPRQHLRSAIKSGQCRERTAGDAIEAARQGCDRWRILALHRQKQVSFQLTGYAGTAQQRAEHRDMPDVQRYLAHTGQPQRTQQQALHLNVTLDAAMAVYFGADLQRLAGSVQSIRTGSQHAAGIAQPGDPAAVEQVCVDPRHLRRNVGTHPQHAPGQLVDQLECLQIEVVAGTRQQGIHVFEQRRHHQLIAVHRKVIQNQPAQALHPERLLGQDILYVFRQQPGSHDR